MQIMAFRIEEWIQNMCQHQKCAVERDEIIYLFKEV